MDKSSNINSTFRNNAIGRTSGCAVSLPTSPYYTDPFDKLIASDQLTYLPNLYLRQYKAVDELVRLRQDFPEQRVLLARPYTRWDAVLDEMRFRSRVMLEVGGI
jgi:hypothetical protein